MMCSYEKSKYGPSLTMPALVWIVTWARSEDESRIASVKRTSQPWRSRP